MAVPQSAMTSANDDVHTEADGAADMATLEAVYREHGAAVLRLLRRRVGNEADAVELAQESWLQLLRYRGQTPEALKALLFRIAVNMAGVHARRSRSRRRDDHLPLEDVPLAADDPPQDELLVQHERRLLIITAIRAMPRRCRQVFVLSRFHGMPRKEIAQRLGISLGMVERHITNGLAFMRKRLGEEQP